MKYEYTSTVGSESVPSGVGWTLLYRQGTSQNMGTVLFWGRQDPTEKLEEEAITQEAKRLRTALVQISSMCGGPEEVSDEALLLVPGEVSAVMREHRKEMECMAKVADNAMRMERESAGRAIEDLRDQKKALKHRVNVMGQEIEDFRKIAGAPDHETAMKVLGGAGGRLNGLFMHVNELEEKLRSVQEQRNDRYLEICSILDASDESWPSLFAKIRALKEREAELEADFAAFVTCSVAGELPPAPDGASDIRRGAYNAVRGLRKRLDEVALERDRTEKERNALRADLVRLDDWAKKLLERIDVLKLECERIEALKSERARLEARLAEAEEERAALGNSVTNASVLLCDCGAAENCGIHSPVCRRRASLSDGVRGLVRENEELKAQVAKLGINLENGRTVTCGKCGETALQVCTHLAEEFERMLAEHRSLKARIAELESRPIHPALVRLAEAVKTWAAIEWEDEKSDPPAEFWKACDGVLDAYRSLPSPLPVVVTCGECEHAIERCGRLNCTHILEYRKDGYCHLGKRRES